MTGFVDRKQELATLESEYSRKEASLVVLYGRRRVGKTELIREFLRTKHGMYYLCTEESDSLNRAAFVQAASSFLDIPALSTARFDRWEDAFNAILGTSQQKERTVIVIDEFQYLGNANPAFPSIFQRIWDTRLKDSNVMVILCGSLISLMTSQVLSYDSPLYGRRTAQIRLQPIPFNYYRDFFPGRTDRELIEYYSITGGVPKYIEMFQPDAKLEDAVRRNLFNRDSFLYDEPNFLLQHEVAEVGTYFSIMKAIAAGNRKPSDIATVLEVKQTNLSRYLTTLIELDMIEREVPVTERNPGKSKRGLYRLKDNFLRFWFRFVQPNASYIEMGRTGTAEEAFKRSFIDGQVAYVYEDVCRQAVWQLADEGKLAFVPTRVGRWWAGAEEADIAAVNEEDHALLLGECKFRTRPVGKTVLQGLERKADLVDWHREDRQVSYIIFSAEGFTDSLRKLAEERSDVVLVAGVPGGRADVAIA